MELSLRHVQEHAGRKGTLEGVVMATARACHDGPTHRWSRWYGMRRNADTLQRLASLPVKCRPCHACGPHLTPYT